MMGRDVLVVKLMKVIGTTKTEMIVRGNKIKTEINSINQT